MIDVNYLNNQPKELAKETNTLKYLFNVLNEIKQELLYIKSNSECEYKNFDAPTKILINSLKSNNSELGNLINDDYSNLLKTFEYVINIFTKSKKNTSASPRELDKIDSPILNSTINNILDNKKTSSKNLFQTIIPNQSENSLPVDKQNHEKEPELIDPNPTNNNPLNNINTQIYQKSNQSSPEKQEQESNNQNALNLQSSLSQAASLHSNSIASNSPLQSTNIDELSSFNLINKIFNEINNQINESLKGSQDSISSSIKDLLNQRNKFKTLNQKADKQMKEIEYAILQRRKLDADEKNAYNLSVKEKSEDKILNLLNEFDELKAQLTINYEDAKKSETNLNEIIKANFLFNLIITIQGIKKLKMSFDEMIDNKIKYLKTIEDVILLAIEAINKLELVGNNAMDQKAFFEMKTVPYSNLDSINLEEAFPKNTFLTVNLPNIESVLSYTQGLNLMISARKKALSFIQKTSGEIVKNIDNLVYNSSKSIKSLVTPKSNLINSCAFIKQIREFLKSSFDLIIKKYEELNKYMTSNLIFSLDSQLKDLSADENSFMQFLNKFQKELNNYKANQAKLLLNKEKATQNIQKVKEQVIKSADDQTNFQKFEKQLIAAMAEEESAKDSLADLNKKFKKFCEENFEFLKKNSEAYKEKEVVKNKEIKEQIFGIIKHKNKLINHILEFLDFKTQIQVDCETCIFSIEKIYLNFFKETALEAFEKKEFSDLVKFLYSKNELEDLSLKKLLSTEENIPNLNLSITSLIKKINFINKDESIYLRKESEYLSNNLYNNLNTINNNNNNSENNGNQASLKEEDLKLYYEKLNFLKTISKKISIRHMFEPNRKRHEDIFYYDVDEIINPNNFSCALSDKILLQGKLFITSKKLVFYSWFNNASLFGTTLIEIPKSDITYVKKEYNMIFDNSLEVQTKNVIFFFTSFVYRDKCYSLIRENIFGETEEMRKSILTTASSNLLVPNLNPVSIADKIDVELENVSGGSPSARQPQVDEIANVNTDRSLINFEENVNNFNAINFNDRVATESSVASASASASAEASANLLDAGNKKGEIKNKVGEASKFQSTAQAHAVVEENKSNALNANNDNNAIRKNALLTGVINNNSSLLNENLIVNNPAGNFNVEDKARKITKSLFDSELSRKLNALHERNYEAYLAKNKRDYNIVCLKDKDLGDVPLPYLYNSLFNIDITCPELNLNKNFFRSLMEIRKDYDINLSKSPEENWNTQTPVFYKENLNNNNNNSFTNLFKSHLLEFNKAFLEDFSNSTFNFDAAEPDKKNMISYKYSLVHPILKKRFMGPSKLNIDDIYKVFFISPKCFIVDNYSYLSGFMMMDCFFSVMQFKFESEFDFVAGNPEGFLDSVNNKTKLTISFGIEFVKTTMFKQKIIDNAAEDTNDFVKNLLFPNIEKVVQGQSKRFLEEKKLFAAQAKKEAFSAVKPKASNIIEKMQENLSSDAAAEEIKKEKEIEKVEEEIKKEEEAEALIPHIINYNKNISSGSLNKIERKEAIEVPEDSSFVQMFLKENIFVVFFVICIVMLIGAKLDILNSTTILIILNMIGFAIVFDKLNAIERRMKRN